MEVCLSITFVSIIASILLYPLLVISSEASRLEERDEKRRNAKKTESDDEAKEDCSE